MELVSLITELRKTAGNRRGRRWWIEAIATEVMDRSNSNAARHKGRKRRRDIWAGYQYLVERAFLFSAESVNCFPNCAPHRTLSPQPPHLKLPFGGSRGGEAQEQWNRDPEEQALAIVYATAAELKAYTYACSLVPAESQIQLDKRSLNMWYTSSEVCIFRQ